jgi:hypothetical protein
LSATDLSCWQDFIGRMEVRDHIEKLTEAGKIPGWFRKEELEYTETWYRSAFEEVKKTYSSKASYVALQDALQMECIQKEGDLQSLEFRDVENHLVRENCVPNWPVPLPLVHPVGDSYGMTRPLVCQVLVAQKEIQVYPGSLLALFPCQTSIATGSSWVSEGIWPPSAQICPSAKTQVDCPSSHGGLRSRSVHR